MPGIPPPVIDLDELMVRYQQADSAATTALIRQVSPMLYRYFAGECRSRADAEDLLQDTWLRIHKVRQTYRPGEPVLPWIYAIARHVKVDGFRRRQRVQSREMPTDSLPEFPAPPIAGEPAIDFQSLVAALSPSQREVVTMLKVTGMSLEEVARATASSVGSVKLKAHRAYTKLRSVLP
jgi:RNA polymerase sigma-70 factor, ECF subfamily